jgi:hypothetical protein
VLLVGNCATIAQAPFAFHIRVRPTAHTLCQDRPVAYDEGLATRIRHIVGGESGLVERKMFGGLGIMLDGNMAVGVSGDNLMVRVDPEQMDELLAEPGAKPFEMGGRATRGFLLVAPEGCFENADLARWVGHGVTYARSLPAK